MKDTAKCTNEKCEKKEYCERYTMEADEWQSYCEFDELNCEFFIKNKNNKQ